MHTQVVHNRIDLLALTGQPRLDLLQEVDPVADRPPTVGPGEGVAGRRAKGTEDVAFATPAIITLLRGAFGRIRHLLFAQRGCSRCRWLGLDKLLTSIALGRQRPPLIHGYDDA